MESFMGSWVENTSQVPGVRASEPSAPLTSSWKLPPTARSSSAWAMKTAPRNDAASSRVSGYVRMDFGMLGVHQAVTLLLKFQRRRDRREIAQPESARKPKKAEPDSGTTA